MLYRHPAVLAAAVVAQPDAKWGETPCAFVELKAGAAVTEYEIIEFCRDHLARFKAPRAVVFGELPKTSTGKIQKFVLREKAKLGAAIDRHHERSPEIGASRSCCARTRDGICTLTMNRPQQMNLLTSEMLAALQSAFDAICEATAGARGRSSPPRARASAPGTT